MLFQVAEWTWWPVRWANWDTTSTVSAWALGPSVPLTNENGGGLFAATNRLAVASALAEAREAWPSPTASEGANRNTRHAPSHGTTRGETLAGAANHWPTVCASDGDRGADGRAARRKRGAGGANLLAEASARWQTPTAQDCEQAGSPTHPMLTNQARWQTPTANDTKSKAYTLDKGDVTKPRPALLGQARKVWMTPNARDWKDTGATQGNRKAPNLGTQTHRQSAAGPPPTSPPSTGGNNPGLLNPDWVCALMGYPDGWLDTSLDGLDGKLPKRRPGSRRGGSGASTERGSNSRSKRSATPRPRRSSR